jgi:bifunctional DNA-binding transcriptional regulator/antitoxin component of YhaV-PrlF toxin-antitoxin module
MPVVVKVTSKGQFTLPMQYRKSLGINKDSYILIDEVGNFLVLEKLQKLDQITKILSAKAKEKKITKQEILKTLKKIQAEKCKQKEKDMFGVDSRLKKKGTKNLRDEYDRNL